MLPDKTQVILGPPGTGKTSTLLQLIENELDSGVSPDKIGFFTFTKRAVNEGMERAMHKFELSKKDLPYGWMFPLLKKVQSNKSQLKIGKA